MKHLIYILLILLTGITACQQRTPYPFAMQQAETVMNSRPDSALALLQSMTDTLTMLPEEAQMYHQLLTIQAKDKLYITHTSDSLINHIVEFYENYGNKDRLMMAYFYQGSTYRDMNDAPRALKAFHQALDAGKYTENLTLLGQIYGQMGTLFSYQKLYDEALEATRKALELYTLQEDSSRYPYLYRDIARIYSAKENNDSALHSSQNIKDSIFFKADIYNHFHKAEAGQVKISNEDWTILASTINTYYPSFSVHLNELCPSLNERETKVCLMIKANLTIKGMSNILKCDASAISKTRKRLFCKITGTEGSGKELDKIILDF